VEEDHGILDEFESLRFVELYIAGILVIGTLSDALELKFPQPVELEQLEQFRLLGRLREKGVRVALMGCRMWWLKSVPEWNEWRTEIGTFVEGGEKAK